MLRRLALLAACLLAACAGGPKAAEPFPSVAFETSIMFLGLELPEVGTEIGGHYAGGNNLRTTSYHMIDGARQRWTTLASQRAEAILRAVGFRVHAVTQASGAQPVHNVQYGLLGQVRQLQVRTRGSSEPYSVEVQTQIGWELLDLGSGTAVFGRQLEGTTREIGEVEQIISVALDQSVSRLMDDGGFRNAIAVPRSVPGGDIPASFRRAVPASGATFVIALNEQQIDSVGNPADRMSAGVITLRGRDNTMGTAFVLTRDGLALADARLVRSMDRLRARLPSGIDRPVRLLRRGGSLDAALIQVACPGVCTTVDWEAPASVPVYTSVMTVSAPLRDGEVPLVSTGRVGGRWGISAGVTIEGLETIEGGEPVGRAASGKVFGVMSVRRGRRAVLMLDEVFRSLKIQVTATSLPGT